ncbi:ankyrin repeat domain-containing protein 11 isoform X2 [Cephus cinctus]|uniref:Ankyrin repeat domain-containing protein 11 isoform X2 n=1 Tax=Cephus cinctus TaxID=211228 RepID=A0AAJ7BGK9_CEPCN|nr:ankyrin repeat domain-containing protein 11 isoform X2 [Cephus cinctus]
MDTKTPPIPQKQPERVQVRKQERTADVSLPPLTPVPSRSQIPKNPGSSWTRGTSYIPRAQDHHQERPYRVLPIGATPLMHACQQADRIRVLRLLREQSETIGFRDRTLRNALHYCMDAGTGGAVATAAPELVNAPDAEGHTPLHLAVIAGDTQLVAVLLANGADVNAKDLEGHSVLHWATVCGEAECVRLVLAAGARPSTPDHRGGSPLHYAAQCCGAAATAELSVPKKLGLKVLQTLLEFGADVNAKDEDGRQPILWAASAGSVEAVLALARAGGSAAAGASDKDGLTALHCAASRGHARCVEALVNLCGSQPDHVDDNGCSALHYASTLGHAEATALLLRLGADPNRQDRKGRTPALCAAAKGQLETLKILAQHGGSLHARTVRGTGVAHEAVTSGRIELIKWLARKRPSTLDVATHDGRTPLHVAALHGHLDACKVLLDNGARINAVLRTSKGNLMTALDAALYRGHRDCAKLIQMHGGTTAQQLRTHRMASNKVFAAKLKVKRAGSSSESESPSSGRRRRGFREPELYYEERWIEKRTRRRGSLKKDRRDSRSFSEEEIRLSKTRKDRERRTRSESARYESDVGEKRKRKRSTRGKLRKHKHEYSESSSESTSFSDLDRSARINHRRRSDRRIRKDTDNEDDQKSDDHLGSVSDDSLEVVVVKKSIEKKSEKVISGRKSKTPREEKERVNCAKARRKSSRGKSKEQDKKIGGDKSHVEDNSDQAAVNVSVSGVSTKKESMELTKSKDAEEPVKNVEEGSSIRKEADESPVSLQHNVHYQRDATDSTSQETVERVTVTALVHKDQTPDTPTSLAKEKIELEDDHENAEPVKRMRPRSARPGSSTRGRTSSAKTKMDHILEKADEMQSALVIKAADFKKSVEELRQQAAQDEDETQGKSGRTSEGGGDEDVVTAEVDDVVTAKDKETKTETPESETPSEDSQKGYSRLGAQSNSSSKTEKEGSSEKVEEEEGSVSPESSKSPEEKTSQERESEKSAEAENSQETSVNDERTSRVKDKAPSGEESSAKSSEGALAHSSGKEDKLKTVTKSKKSSASKSRPSTAKDKSSPDSKKSGSPPKSSSQERSEGTEMNNKTKVIDTGKKKGKTQSKGEQKRRKEIKKKIDSPGSRTMGSSERESLSESRSRSIESTKKDSPDKSTLEASLKNPEEEVSRVIEKSLESSKAEEKQHEEKDTDLENFDQPPKSTKSSIKKAETNYGEANRVDLPKSLENLQKSELHPEKSMDDEEDLEISKIPLSETEAFRFIDDSSSERKSTSSPRSKMPRCSRPSTGKGRSDSARSKKSLIESSEDCSPDRSAIVAVIESPEWEEDEEDEEIEKEIREAIGEDIEQDTEPEEDNSLGVMRVLPSTSEDDTPRTGPGQSRTSDMESLPQVHPRPRPRLLRAQSPQELRRARPRTKQRRDSGGRDSGIEPSPRISRIPKRTIKCYPNTEKQQALRMETITRDVQISLRRYHLERKIFFQLMELKRLQIRHGRANEQVLVKRQVEAFHRAGTAGPALGVAKYDQPLTFRHFEAFLYEQLRRLQKRPATPEWCTEAKQCTQKTHRCHHATSAYTSVPVYTYLGGGIPERTESLLPKIEGRGKGQMTVEVSHGEEKQIIALPAERLDRSKRYFVTFTVHGDTQDVEKPKPLQDAQRNTKSV